MKNYQSGKSRYDYFAKISNLKGQVLMIYIMYVLLQVMKNYTMMQKIEK